MIPIFACKGTHFFHSYKIFCPYFSIGAS